jgi:hypothetical protein
MPEAQSASSALRKYGVGLVFHVAVVCGFLAAPLLVEPAGDAERRVLVDTEQVTVYRQDSDLNDPQDPALFAASLQDTDGLDIAWIHGSTVNLGPRGARHVYLPTLVAKRLAESTNQHVNMSGYAQGRSAFGDTYVAAQHVLRARPDLLVVTLNSFWVLNDVVVSQYPSWGASLAAESARAPSLLFPFSVSIGTPGDVLIAGLETLAEETDRYWQAAHWINSTLDDALLTPVPAARPDVPRGFARRFYRAIASPSDFWWDIGESELKGSVGAKRLSDGSAVSSALLFDLMEEAERLEVPLFLYLSPIDTSPSRRDEVIQAKEAVLRREAFKHDPTLVRIEATALNRIIPGITYRNFAHVDNPSTMPTHLTASICAQMLANNLTSTCQGD